nr:hypothetical protein [Burkholderia humptydooensis]
MHRGHRHRNASGSEARRCGRHRHPSTRQERLPCTTHMSITITATTRTNGVIRVARTMRGRPAKRWSTRSAA